MSAFDALAQLVLSYECEPGDYMTEHERRLWLLLMNMANLCDDYKLISGILDLSEPIRVTAGLRQAQIDQSANMNGKVYR